MCQVVLAIALITGLYGCEEHDIAPTRDFFPLEQGTKASYRTECVFSWNQSVWAVDTITLSVSGDTLIDNLRYKKIVNAFGGVEKVVRREGDQYFGMNHEVYIGFTKEYMFLDVTRKAGDRWEHIKNEGTTKTEYVVKEVNAKHVVNGVEYTNVIKLEVNYYDNYDDGVNLKLRHTATHYYADGVGEIYAYYPTPLSGMYSDVSYSILPAAK